MTIPALILTNVGYVVVVEQSMIVAVLPYRMARVIVKAMSWMPCSCVEEAAQRMRIKMVFVTTWMIASAYWMNAASAMAREPSILAVAKASPRGHVIALGRRMRMGMGSAMMLTLV